MAGTPGELSSSPEFVDAFLGGQAWRKPTTS
jgi:hypothetical protein